MLSWLLFTLIDTVTHSTGCTSLSVRNWRNLYFWPISCCYCCSWWDSKIGRSFLQTLRKKSVRSSLCSSPVLAALDSSRPFKLDNDAATTGAVLLQDEERDVCHTVCYFSTKFKHHQLNCFTVEETLALLLALQHFAVYVFFGSSPVTVFTDHNPLLFLNRMYNRDQWLMCWALLVQDYKLVIRKRLKI